jgi:hypothetical protein
MYIVDWRTRIHRNVIINYSVSLLTLPRRHHNLHYITLKIRNDFNVYLLLCENNTLKQMTAHSCMADYVYALLYNAAKHV